MQTLKSLTSQSTNRPKRSVLLLRASTGSDGSDRYQAALSEQGYRAISVAVLETTYTNLDRLRTIITDGPAKRGYAGVVITSARSCEAWKSVALELVNADPQMEENEADDWAKVPFYVVGPSTAKALADIGEIVGGYPYAPRDIRGAVETGTGEKLAQFILQDLSSVGGSKKLLYLTGDKNRDTLPSILSGGGIELDPIQMYETRGSPTFEADLQQALGSTGLVKGQHQDWWIVSFAPSEADFTTPVIRKYFALPSPDEPHPSSSAPAALISAIGPTSASHLREKLSLRVDVVSPKPNPEALARAITDFDTAHHRI